MDAFNNTNRGAAFDNQHASAESAMSVVSEVTTDQVKPATAAAGAVGVTAADIQKEIATAEKGFVSARKNTTHAAATKAGELDAAIEAVSGAPKLNLPKKEG